MSTLVMGLISPPLTSVHADKLPAAEIPDLEGSRRVGLCSISVNQGCRCLLAGLVIALKHVTFTTLIVRLCPDLTIVYKSMQGCGGVEKFNG